MRQPSPCVRALCESGVLFHMSLLKLHFTLHTSHCTLHTPRFTLHTTHFTLHTALFALHTSLHTALLRLHTSQNLTRMHLRTWQHQMTTIMQPFQCDLQPQIQETHRTTTRCRTQRRNGLTSKRSKPAAHTRHLSSPAAATLHIKMQGLLRLPPRNKARATFMQPLQCVFAA